VAQHRWGRSDGRWRPALVALLALALGLAFRLWHIDREPLWLDEAYSAFAADQGWGFLWRVVPRYDAHPPFYYSLVHLWRLMCGDGLLAARVPGLFCGVATVAAGGYAAARIARLVRFGRIRADWLVAMAVALMALQPLMVAMSRQLRPYPVMILVYTMALIGLLRLIEDAVLRRRPDRRALLLVMIAQAAMLWLHSLGGLFALAIALAGLVAVVRPGLTRRDWGWLIGGEVLVGLVYLPAFLILLREERGWAHGTWLHFTLSSVPMTIGNVYIDWNMAGRLVGLAAAVLGAFLLAGRVGGRRIVLVLGVLAFVPVALSVLLSETVTPVFLDRTLSPVAVPGLMFVAAGLVWPGRRHAVALLPLAIIAGSMAWNDRAERIAGPPQDWYGIIAWLKPRVEPGDVVWAYPNDGALPLAYALRDKGEWLPVRPIPAPVPAFNAGGFAATGVQGVVSLYPPQIAALMATSGAKAPPTLWLLRLNGWLYDPGDRMLRALERDRVPVAHVRRGPIDLIGLRRRELPPVAAAE
jgi:mannosyltransferase